MRRLLKPSLGDLFFAALLVAAFARPGGWQSLLADGDAGWHIRTGQIILASGAVPRADPFSFTRAGQPWFAWEWLADLIFAGAYDWRGLAAVAALAAATLSLAGAALFLWLLRRGAGLWVAAALALAAFSASSAHFLARPHVFSILFYVPSLWMLDEDRRRPGPWIWALAPLAALWANLHAGFTALIATLALASAAAVLERRWIRVRRYGTLTALCAAATLANPYGWRLHAHILAYLGSPWILDHVQEFQSPSIRSEGMLVFAVLLLAGVALAAHPLSRGEWFEGLLTLAWGWAALRSARHIPFYAISAAPVAASEIAAWWRGAAGRASGGSPRRILWDLAEDLGRGSRASVWMAAAVALTLVLVPRGAAPDFPEARFPAAAVARYEALLAPAGAMPHILTSDQWADYLIYRLYPRQRVFFDGRSDFYGPALLADYRTLMAAGRDWRGTLARRDFRIALLPRDWPLASVLENEPGWTRVYRDDVAVLYARGARSGEPVLTAGRRP